MMLFCSKENLSSAASHLSSNCKAVALFQELVSYGFKSLISDGQLDIIQMVNSTNDLLQLFKHQALSPSSEDKLQKTLSELSHYHAKCQKLENDLLNQQRESKQSTERDRQAQTKIKGLEDSIRLQTKEIKKTRADAEAKTQAYQNLHRKAQQDHMNLLEQIKKLQKIKQISQPGVDVSSPLRRGDSARRRWETASETNKLHEDKWKHSVESLNIRLQTTLELNQKLKSLTCSFAKELEVLLDSFHLSADETAAEDHFILKSPVRRSVPNVLDLEAEEVWKHIDLNFLKLKALTSYAFSDERLLQLPRVKLLQERVDNLQNLVEAKEKVILRLTSSNGFAKADLDLLEERESLKQNLKRYKEEKVRMANERKMYTEGMLRLVQERTEFERDKASAIRQFFLSQSPRVAKNRICSPGGDFLPPSPLATGTAAEPLEKKSFPTPTTPELYAELGLKLPPQREQATPTQSITENIPPNAKPQSTAITSQFKRNLFPEEGTSPVPEDNEPDSLDESSDRELIGERRKKLSLKLVRENTVIIIKEEESECEEPDSLATSPTPSFVPAKYSKESIGGLKFTPALKSDGGSQASPPPLVPAHDPEYSSMYEYSGVQNLNHAYKSYTIKTNATYFQSAGEQAPDLSIIATVQDSSNRVSTVESQNIYMRDSSL